MPLLADAVGYPQLNRQAWLIFCACFFAQQTGIFIMAAQEAAFNNPVTLNNGVCDYPPSSVLSTW
ncbi:hypothetical protein ACLBOM_07895 [Escherichia coli]